jgi:HEAT repeat protein/beta-lactamase regulating signal transducer with metallopeptidase domain
MLEVMIWGGLRVAATLLLMMGIVVALRSASAATRHAVWRAGFGVALLLPVVAFALPWRIEVLPGRMVAPQSALSRAPAADAPASWKHGEAPAPVEADVLPLADASVDEAVAAPPAESAANASAVFDVRLALLLVWLAGALLLAARLVVGHIAVSRIVRGGRRLETSEWTSPLYEAADIVDVATDVALVVSDKVTMPFTAGVRRPVIVLPESANSWDLERRRAVLMHELAHVRRADLVPHHIARWVCALHWFNPLAWAGARRMRAESERAADDLVLTAGTRASDYADHLLQIVSSAGRSLMPAPALPLAQRREFEGRMLAILEPGIRRGGPGRMQSLAVTALVLLMTLPLAALDRESTVTMVAEDSISDEREWSAERDIEAGYDFDAETGSTSGQPPMEASIADMGPVEPLRPKRGFLQNLMGGVLDEDISADESQLSPEIVPKLVETLADPDVGVRQAVVAALGEVADPRAVQALIRILREDPVDEVRAAAAWALGEIEDPSAVAALSEALRTDVCEDVRKNAAWALGQIEDARAVDALGVALNDDNMEVRHTALWALGEIESPAAVPSLVAALGSDDAEVRQTAAWALGQIEDARAVEGLVGALRSGDPELRETAAWALGQIESPAATQALMPLVTDQVASVREAAIHALAQIEDPAAAPAMARALSDANADVRAIAAHALADMELATAPPALIAALRDSNADVRMAAAHALGEIADRAAIDALSAALDDGNEDVRLAAIHALLEMDSDLASGALLELLDHEDPNVRKHAAEALGQN